MNYKTATRTELLADIERRMREHGIFYADVWERILLTETKVLREISESNFEDEVLAMRGKS